MLKKIDKIMNYVIVGAICVIITMLFTTMLVGNKVGEAYTDDMNSFVEEVENETIVIEGVDSLNRIHYHKVDK